MAKLMDGNLGRGTTGLRVSGEGLASNKVSTCLLRSPAHCVRHSCSTRYQQGLREKLYLVPLLLVMISSHLQQQP